MLNEGFFSQAKNLEKCLKFEKNMLSSLLYSMYKNFQNKDLALLSS